MPDKRVENTITLTPEAWQQVKALVDVCIELPLSERARHLQANCSDPAIRREVISLLAAYEASEEFLDDPSAIAEDMAAVAGVSSNEHQRIGSYKLMEEIGRGGMGTVYRAVRADDVFQIVVALKVVRRGMDSDVVLRRFLTERQILASLEHPYIARILDGGTTDDGLPYFVMEYVDGRSLTKYCDQEKLSISDRLILFRKVCEAVSYAHQNLVVHRDLKPSNILVTADGTPKLLDFGIAKILGGAPGEDALDATRTALRMATPAYASPEQIRGELTGVGSDVYSLGVILYELLTGHPPYRLSTTGPEALAQVICEREPTRASTVVALRESIGTDAKPVNIDPSEISKKRRTTVDALRRKLQGDLDNVVAMALRKESQRRYGSVEQLSEDLRRHMEGMPVLARKDTVSYRATKFIGRHRIGLAASLAVALALCVTTTTAVWKAQRLSDRISQDHRLASMFLVEVHDAIARLPGSTPAREVLLSQSLRYLSDLEKDAGNDPGARRAHALAYERFAELQAGAVGGGLGQSHAAIETYSKAQTLREKLAAEYPEDKDIQFELAKSYLLASILTGRSGSAEKRLEYDRKALALLQQLSNNFPDNQRYKSMLARSHSSLGYALGHFARWKEARPHFLKALSIRSDLMNAAPEDFAARRETAQIHYRLGVSYAQGGEPAKALPYLNEALDIQTALLAEDRDNQQLRSETASSRHFLGVTLRNLGRYSEALMHTDAAVAIREAMLAEDERDARSRSLLAGNYAERASILLAAGRPLQAIAPAHRALELQSVVVEVDAQGVPARLNMADFERRAAEIHAAAALTFPALSSQRISHLSTAGDLYSRSASLYAELERAGHILSEQVAREAASARREASRFATGQHQR